MLVQVANPSGNTDRDIRLPCRSKSSLEQSLDFRARFAPVLAGLRLAARGESFAGDGSHTFGARRFLGWSLGRHRLMPQE